MLRVREKLLVDILFSDFLVECSEIFGEITLSLIASCSYAYTLSDMRLHLPGIAKETPSPVAYADHLIRVLKIGDAS